MVFHTGLVMCVFPKISRLFWCVVVKTCWWHDPMLTIIVFSAFVVPIDSIVFSKRRLYGDWSWIVSPWFSLITKTMESQYFVERVWLRSFLNEMNDLGWVRSIVSIYHSLLLAAASLICDVFQAFQSKESAVALLLDSFLDLYGLFGFFVRKSWDIITTSPCVFAHDAGMRETYHSLLCMW